MKRAVSVFIELIYLLLLPVPALAECTYPGTAICNGRACPGETRPAGTIIYNKDHDVVQACRADGLWHAIGPFDTMSDSGPPGCGTVGAQCGDGTIYIGTVGGEFVFATSSAYEVTRPWGPMGEATGMGFCTLTFDFENWEMISGDEPSCSDGAANTAHLVGLSSSFPAAEYCDGLEAHNHEDWHLPSRDELDLMRNNGSPIADVDVDGEQYWSSSESSDDNVYFVRFDNGGNLGTVTKNQNQPVRCVRR